MSVSVYLNVYDLPEQEANNEALSGVGVGFFHSGVEIHTERGSRYEYSFSTVGIQRTVPQLPGFGHLREQIFMGRVDGDLGHITSTVNALGRVDFRPGMYNIVHRNCNHFSDAFLTATVDKNIPDWVNRAANLASTFAAKPSETGATPAGTAFAMPGVVKGPDLSKYKDKVGTTRVNAGPTPEKEDSSQGIFGWLFGTGGSNNTSSSDTNTPAPAVARRPPSIKKSDPKAKKPLTEKQQAALAKIRGK
jgi:hypothetical protein